MPIRVLSPDVASRIAAGEVVERPASVVKELLDNALDAGATQIAVEVQGGGSRLIRVVDNGSGIQPEEVDLAFERFATSKVSSLDDLESILSLGFRGEALPSIAAVADVTMVTRAREELAGTFVNLRDGAILQRAKRGCPTGTTVTVRHLFRSFPARLKFLKSAATENGHIGQVVTQYSMAFPEVRFTLIIDGRTTFRSAGTGILRDVLGAVYGVENARLLLQVEGSGERDSPLGTRIGGYVSPPSVTRATRSYMSFFVNRRWVQSRMLSYALEEAYRGLIMAGRHPIAAVNIMLHPQEVDVNVHPAKSEVKFRSERDVFSAVRTAVREALLARAPTPTLDTLAGPSPPRREPLQGHRAERFVDLYAGPRTDLGGSPATQPDAGSEPASRALPILRVVGQLGNTYVVAEAPDGMYLIDQHAAHERVQFEKIRSQRQRKAVEVQGLLQPVPVELTMRQHEVLETHAEELAEYGFGVEHFGERTHLLRAVPAMLQGRDTAMAFVGLLDFLAEESGREDWNDRVAVSLACHSAVRAGQVLSQEEMQDLVRQLERTSQPRTCPHGRPTMMHLSATQLDKGFGRR